MNVTEVENIRISKRKIHTHINLKTVSEALYSEMNERVYSQVNCAM